MRSLRFFVATGSHLHRLDRFAERGNLAPSLRFVRRGIGQAIVKAAPLRVRGVEFILGQLAAFDAAPCLGGETAQHARPAADGGFVAVGMQAGMEIGNRTPGANEGGFRKSFGRVSERDTKMPLIQRSKLV